MEIIAMLNAVNASLMLVEALLPQIKDLASRGEITKEQQEQLKERIDSFRTKTGGQFDGPEWKV